MNYHLDCMYMYRSTPLLPRKKIRKFAQLIYMNANSLTMMIPFVIPWGDIVISKKAFCPVTLMTREVTN